MDRIWAFFQKNLHSQILQNDFHWPVRRKALFLGTLTCISLFMTDWWFGCSFAFGLLEYCGVGSKASFLVWNLSFSRMEFGCWCSFFFVSDFFRSRRNFLRNQSMPKSLFWNCLIFALLKFFMKFLQIGNPVQVLAKSAFSSASYFDYFTFFFVEGLPIKTTADRRSDNDLHSLICSFFCFCCLWDYNKV